MACIQIFKPIPSCNISNCCRGSADMIIQKLGAPLSYIHELSRVYSVYYEITCFISNKAYRIALPWLNSYTSVKVVVDGKAMGLYGVVVDNCNADMSSELYLYDGPGVRRSSMQYALVITLVTCNYSEVCRTA